MIIYFLIDTVIKTGGAGRHQSELSPSQLTLMLKVISTLPNLVFWHLSSVSRESSLTNFRHHLQLLTPGLAAHGLTVTCVKSSVLLLYRRLFVTSAFRRATVVVGTLCITWLFASFFGQLFLCSPMAAAWNPKLVFSSKCRDVQAIYYGVAISNMILDVIILCMPLPVIWGLPLSRQKKLGCCGAFCLGGL